MPLYEYECLKNGHRFELIRKFADPPVQTCIHCRGKVRKLVSASSIAFKGSGWYVTDYARKKNTAPTNGNGKGDVKGASGSESGSAEAGSESKSATSDAGGSEKKPKRRS